MKRAVGYYLALGGVGLAAAVLGPTLPGLAAQTGSSLSAISVLFVAKAAGYLIGALLAGRAYDRLPGHPLMTLGVLALAGAMALVPWAPWVWLLVVALLVIGLAEGAIDVGCNALIVWAYGDRVGPYMNGLHFAFGLGAFLSPVIVAQAMGWGGGLSWSYGLMAILILPSAAWLAGQASPPPSPAGAHERSEPLRGALVALFVACFFFYVGAEIGFGAWVFTYARTLGLADEVAAAYLTSAFWGALTLGRLLAIPLAARFRPRTLLAADLTGCLVSVGLVLLLPRSTEALWIGAIGAGLSMASVFPTLMNLAGRRLRLTGRVTSLFFVGASLGGMFLPWLIGQLFEPVGAWVTMAAIVVSLLLDVAAFAGLMRYRPPAAAAG